MAVVGTKDRVGQEKVAIRKLKRTDERKTTEKGQLWTAAIPRWRWSGGRGIAARQATVDPLPATSQYEASSKVRSARAPRTVPSGRFGER